MPCPYDQIGRKSRAGDAAIMHADRDHHGVGSVAILGNAVETALHESVWPSWERGHPIGVLLAY
jgi:hypothetical protein